MHLNLTYTFNTPKEILVVLVSVRSSVRFTLKTCSDLRPTMHHEYVYRSGNKRRKNQWEVEGSLLYVIGCGNMSSQRERSLYP